MACNCKKKVELEDRYGTEEEESWLGKCYRFSMKALLFLFASLLAIIIIPIIIFVAIYKITFGKDSTIVLPKFLGKYLKD